MAPFLQKIRRRQIDQHTLRWQGESHRGQGGANTLPSLIDRLIGQAYNKEGRQTRRDLHLYLDRYGLDAREGEGSGPGDGV